MATKKTTKGGKKKTAKKSTVRKSAPSKTARAQAYSKKKTAKAKTKSKAKKKSSYAKYPKNPGFSTKLQHPYLRKDSTMIGERYGDRMTGVPYSRQKYLSEDRRDLGWQTEWYVDGSRGDGKAVKKRR